MPKSITIQKNPTVPESSNYQLLRQKGLEYIQQLGSRLWTDYNIHDPGITILEALCYAITDLGYRSSLDIKDLLALAVPETADPDNQLPADKRQAFFTARNILTVNPWTTDDFRKLLINIDGIKNGWLHCKDCPCEEFYLYANCVKSILQYKPPTGHKVIIKGLYDVLLEFEDEEKSGNLNSGKIKYNFSYPNGLQQAKATIEMRLPSWAKLEKDKAKYKSFRNPDSIITAISVLFISGNKGDTANIPPSPETVLDNALRGPIFATLEVTFQPDKNNPATDTIDFADVPLTVWFRNTEERRALELDDLQTVILDATVSGIFPKYLEKIKIADLIIEGNKNTNDYINGCVGGGIFIHKSRNCLVENVKVNEFNGDTFSWQVTEQITVKGCEASSGNGLGFHPGMGSDHSIIEDCISHHNTGEGIFLCWRVQNGIFKNNTVYANSASGISIGHQDTDNIFENNNVFENGKHGVVFRNETEQNSGHRNTFTNNVIENNGVKEESSGFYIGGVTHGINISNNIIRSTGKGNQSTAIVVGKKSSGIIAAENKISGSREIVYEK